ncbi:MAG: flagellar hook-basal body complex protein [Lachnospiraceae bacterium]|jgi:flagellar basal-body rod protein FlgG|nr:flagellar hook-basal body complex protein [Lachnospiraceae bacterium]
MYSSFYAAAQGAIGQQSRMDVISNNLANVNNYGFKPKVGTFQDLMYYNLNNWQGDETKIQAGTGIVLEKADTNFAPSGYDITERDYDFAIVENGFFMMRNPVNNEITYTRNGRFSLSQRGNEFYLVNDAENLVLDRNQNPIRLVGDEVTGRELEALPGIFDFAVKNGMQNVGDNEYAPVEKNGQPILQAEDPLQGALESSGTDLAMDLVRMIESQRAYSYALKMVQTSDEVVQTVNSLRS